MALGSLKRIGLGVLSISILVISICQATYNASTYTNPILQKIGADPWVIKHQDYYYMTYTTNDNITILRSKILTDWNNADVKLAFTPPENTSYSYDLWAPELHQFEDKWYIIFTADVDPDSPKPEKDMLCDYSCPAVNHRMFVLESSTSDPWTSQYNMKAELNTDNQFAIDGTYLQVEGQLYHVYSCWYDAYTSWPAMLCITRSKSSLSAASMCSSEDTKFRLDWSTWWFFACHFVLYNLVPLHNSIRTLLNCLSTSIN